MAQMGIPSMELPILFAFTWPERVADSGVPSFDPIALGSLSFEAVRQTDFPMLALGIEAGRAGGASPAVFNAANEAAVALFLDGNIRFGEIPILVRHALNELTPLHAESLDALWRADAAARTCVMARSAQWALSDRHS